MARYKIGNQIVNEQGQPDMSVLSEYSPGAEMSSYLATLPEYQDQNSNPTVGQVYSGLGNVSGADQATMAKLGLSGLSTDSSGNLSYALPNQQDTYNQTLAMFQDEINSLDKVYAQQKANLRAELARKSAGELGSQRAIMAGAGMLGQVSGMAQKSGLEAQQAERLNTGLSTIDAELNAKKSSLYSTARTLAQQSQADKVKASSGGIDTYLNWLKDKATKAQSDVSNIVKTAIANGVDMSKSDDYVKQIAKELGVDESSITAEFATQKSVFDKAQLEAKKTEAEMAKTKVETTNLENKAPDTITAADGRVLQYNPSTKLFDITVSGPKPVEKTEADIKREEAQSVEIQKSQNVLDVAKRLKEKLDAGYGTRAIGTISGALGGILAGGKTSAFLNDYNQLAGLLQLDAAKYLKGSGQISDAERKLLASAATDLNPKLQTPEAFANSLNTIINKMEKLIGGTQNEVVRLKSPEGIIYDVPKANISIFLQNGYTE